MSYLSLLGIGRVQDYAKNMQMQAKARNKNAGLLGNTKLVGGNVSAEQRDKIESAVEWYEQAQGYISTLREATEEMQKNAPLERIKSRLKAGKRLTMEELEYLRRNAPDLYRAAMAIEAARDEHRKALERCQTKEQAQELHATKMEALGARAKSVGGEGAETIEMEAAALTEEFEDFIKSAVYINMPDEQKDKHKEDEERERR